MDSHSSGWIGVDLDGTLAHYDGWKGFGHIGAPIPEMVERVKRWLAEGKNVKIFTARVDLPAHDTITRPPIQNWCKQHLGQELEITCKKDYGMIELWDDRCVQLIPNTGRPVAEYVATELLSFVNEQVP